MAVAAIQRPLVGQSVLQWIWTEDGPDSIEVERGGVPEHVRLHGDD